jgi:hypothetical protein
MDIREISVKLDGGGNGAKVAISGVSAQSAALSLKPTPGLRRRGRARLGARLREHDRLLRAQRHEPDRGGRHRHAAPAGSMYRLSGIKDGEKLAFITSGAAGNVWIYPGA